MEKTLGDIFLERIAKGLERIAEIQEERNKILNGTLAQGEEIKAKMDLQRESEYTITEAFERFGVETKK